MPFSQWAGRAEAGTGRSWPDEEKLERALIAGLMLEVILEDSSLPSEPQARRRHVQNRLKFTLAARLAGRVTLERFRALARKLDQWFPLYYSLCATSCPPPADLAEGRDEATPGLMVQESLLRDWFKRHAGLLPRRRHRKLDGPGLQEFLRQTRGGWFRLRDFQGHFAIDRKTAWEYLQKFRHAGLLNHNRRRSTAVRYCLDAGFLPAAANPGAA